METVEKPEVAQMLEPVKQIENGIAEKPFTSEEYKVLGNECFKQLKFEEASQYYTLAVNHCSQNDNKQKAIYFGNRAFCQLKLENYGLAITDANEAISCDSKYAKAYYRKADAYIALDKYESAKECLSIVIINLKCTDKDAQEKFKFVKKVIKERLFAECLARPDAIVQINPSEIIIESTYIGPKIENENCEISAEWVLELMDYLKNQKKLHKKYAIMLIQKCSEQMKKLGTINDIAIPDDKEFTVCGDTHGQYYDLLNIFKINGNPSEENPYLFNGDFVDRGSFSVEVILTLIAWKVQNPNCMHLTRGNHEAKNMNKLYGFEGEVLAKYDSKVYDLFSEFFCNLPLSYVLNKQVMVCHGGLFSQDGVKLSDIKAIDRFKEPPESGFMTDLLWSDPIKENGRQPSKRGISVGFGPDIAHKFLDDNNLKILIRSHEMKELGYEIEADGRVITVFSAPNYCDQMKNQGAFIRFLGKDMKPKFTQFSWVEHPNIPVMAYSRQFLPFM